MPKARIPEADYAYAVGRLRALEKQLLNSNELERMSLADDAKEAYKILNELDYSTHLGDVDSLESFQEVLNVGLKDTKELLKNSIPHRWVLNLLWFRFDAHNIKTILKAKLAEKSFEEIEKFLLPLGAIEIKKLRKFIIDGESTEFEIYEEHEERIKKAILKATERFTKTGNPFDIDTTIDKAALNMIHAVARDSGSEFLVQFVEKYVDLQNIRNFLRLKYMGREMSVLNRVLSDKGTIPVGTYNSFSEKSVEDFIEFTKSTAYEKIVLKGTEAFKETESFLGLEKEIENYLTEFIQISKRIAIGPEPVVAYFLAKNNNALIIRMIMVGKLNQLSPTEIKERLRELYIS